MCLNERGLLTSGRLRVEIYLITSSAAYNCKTVMYHVHGKSLHFP